MTVMWVKKKKDVQSVFLLSEKFYSYHSNSNVCLTDVIFQGYRPTLPTSIRSSAGAFRHREKQAFKRYWKKYSDLLIESGNTIM